jgi:Beta-lactamase class A
MALATVTVPFRRLCCLTALIWCSLAGAAEPVETTLVKLRALDESTQGRLGVYVKNLHTGEEIAYHAERKWNLASLVKIPLAIAVLQAVENQQLALDDKLVLQQSEFAVSDLLKRSLEDNDSTATDLLIHKLGVEHFNQQTQRNVGGEDLGPFTTPGQKPRNNPNSGTLRAMGTLMERLSRSELLNTKHTDMLLDHMENASTSDKRPKTGTQDRACNLGITNARDLSKSVVIVVCAEGFGELEHAEKSFTAIAAILVADGRVP